MTATVTSINQAPVTHLDFALAYASLGWHVFPCHYILEDSTCSCGTQCKTPGKHPFSRLVPKGQDHATTDENTIRSWWQRQPSANIAVLMSSSGLMAVDIDPRNGGWDTIDALESQHGQIASEVTQFTGGGGEHRVFVLPPGSGTLPGKLGAGVDVKINGYIMVEPSNHASGKRYEWEVSSSPLDGVLPSPLPDWIRGSFGQSSTKYTLPDGPLTPLSDADRADLTAALQYIAANDRDTWLQMGMALHSTLSGSQAFSLWDSWSQQSSKYDPVDQTRVWHSFRNRGLSGVTKATIYKLAQDSGWRNGGPTLQIKATPIESIHIAKPEEIETPESLLSAPGILGQMAAWVNDTSNKPQPQFAMQAAIGFMATVLGRRYVTDNRNWPSLFLLNIGKSSSGKEHAKHAIEDALEQCAMGDLIGPASYTSDSGLLSALMAQPSHITVIDEFGKVLEQASVKNNSRAQSTLRGLMEVWGRCHGTLRAQGYSTFGMTAKEAESLNDRIVRNPALTLLAMTTPESFFDSIGSAAARDGFLNRFLIVESDIGRQPSKPFKNVDLPESVIQWAQSVTTNPEPVGNLEGVDQGSSMKANPVLIPISKEAQTLFDEFELVCLANMDKYEEAGMAEMFGRTREMAMRLALIVAVGCGSRVVGQDHASWSIQYCDYYANKTVERLRTSVADSEFDGLKRQVLDLIARSTDKGMTARELSRASAKFNKVDRRAQENVLSSLQYLGDIALVEVDTNGPRKRQAWVAISQFVDNVDENPIYPPEDE